MSHFSIQRICLLTIGKMSLCVAYTISIVSKHLLTLQKLSIFGKHILTHPFSHKNLILFTINNYDVRLVTHNNTYDVTSVCG